MVHAELTIINEQGIHLGPANKIANLADRYDCQIHFKTEYMDVNAKSIINLISGTFRQGDVIQCVCDGPDEKEALKKELKRLADQRQINVVFTTGGTGFSERDVTPEATIEVCNRMANGIAEAIRNYSMTITPRAMFSRGVSGIRGKTLIINLPGSPKAVKEALRFLLPHLEHGLEVLRGTSREYARV